MFEHTSNSFLFLSVAFIALIVWLDSRTSRPPHAFAGHGDQPRRAEPATPAPSYQATPATPARPAQAPTVAATAQPEQQARPAAAPQQ